jgi:hypothetical protein
LNLIRVMPAKGRGLGQAFDFLGPCFLHNAGFDDPRIVGGWP